MPVTGGADKPIADAFRNPNALKQFPATPTLPRAPNASFWACQQKCLYGCHISNLAKTDVSIERALVDLTNVPSFIAIGRDNIFLLFVDVLATGVMSSFWRETKVAIVSGVPETFSVAILA